jgi:signal transduction histidine kinase
MVDGLRGYLLTGERSFIESYHLASFENDSILLELSASLTDSSQSGLLKEIKGLNDQWTGEFTGPLRQAERMIAVSPKRLDTFNAIYKAKFASGREMSILVTLKDKFREFTTLEYNSRESRSRKLSASLKYTGALSLVFTVISVVVSFVVISFLIRKISGRIRQMTKMADDIAGGNYDVHLPENGKDELSPLGRSLNTMSTELARNIALLRRSNEELDQFAHVVSHDMKGPLRGISHVVTWMEEDHLDELTPKIREYLAIIKGRIVRAENLIGGLLSYARIGREKLKKEKINLNLLVEEVLENLPEQDREKVAIASLPVIYSEKIIIFQLFGNLIGNAIKYNDKNKAIVSVYYKEYEKSYEFFIEDNGPGIAGNHHQRIFVIFQTLADNESVEGTGIGLAIVKKILDGKGQKINLVSEPGKGSVFSFTWPKD